MELLNIFLGHFDYGDFGYFRHVDAKDLFADLDVAVVTLVAFADAHLREGLPHLKFKLLNYLL